MKRSALAGKKATVIVERNGAAIRVDDVAARDAGMVLADLLTVFRTLTKQFDELTPDLDAVGGGQPIEVVDDEWAEEGQRKRVGFTTTRQTKPL